MSRASILPLSWARFARLASLGILLALSSLTGAGQNPYTMGEQDELSPLEREQRRFYQRIDALKSQKLLWREAWMRQDLKEDDLSKLAVELATSTAMRRDALKRELNRRAKDDPAYKTAIKDLDIGRHQFLKTLFARALDETNKRLAAKKLTLLDRTVVLNSGGTGDFTRDIDVTVFAGDDVREATFFEAMRDIARQMGLKVKAGDNDSVAKGIEIDALEVAFHRGRNDLPDPRTATDPVEFQLEYRRVIEQQAKNPEAYFGYGGDTEVVGRRFLNVKPGQTLVQTFERTSGGVRYTPQIASCMREARAVLHGAADGRIRRAQRAVHATNDYLQAARHEVHGGDATQGAMKYAGRGLDELCAFHGFKNWTELVREDRIQLLARLHPPGFLDQPGARDQLAKVEQSLEVAYKVYLTKKLPDKLAAAEASAELDTQRYAALVFLRQACTSMAASVAQEMLDPPSLDPRFLASVNQHDGEWQRMSAVERDALARQRDETYRRCVSASAMENLLVMVEQLRLIDTPEFNPRGLDAGGSTLARILDRADERTRPLLEIAARHAEASFELQRPTSPEAQRRAQQAMEQARAELAERLHKPAPGAEGLASARQLGARDFIRAQQEGRLVVWSQGVQELSERLRRHVEESFPENSYEATKRQLQALGVKGYLAQRVHEEVFQLGNVVDALSLIEMYQGGASRDDYAWFITQNLVGRCYWGLGYLMQASQVRTPKDLEALGQNLVFDALSRVIPGVAQAKIFFDIEKGLVVVTVGWALNQANADLIDALYTGEAGRLNDGTAGKAGGRIRDSGFCVLPAQLVQKVVDPKSKQTGIRVDQAGVYQSFFTQWVARPAGRDVPFDEINARPPVAGPAGALLAAHDALARALLEVGSEVEPAWFGERPAYQDQDRLDKAMKGFVDAFGPLCRKETDRVLAESAVRQFWQSDQDAIAEGLYQRLLGDLIGGMLGTWQTRRLEMQYARRQVERMAGLADLEAMASALAEPATDGPMPAFDLVVDAGLVGREKTAQTRYGRLALSVSLQAGDSVPPNMTDVGITLEPLEFVPGPGNEGFRRTTMALSGIQKVRVVAKADQGRGRVLAEKVVDVPVAIYPDAMHLATLADRFRFELSGDSTITESYRDESRTSEGHESYTVNIPFAGTDKPPHGVPVQWSGNQFTLSVEEEIAQPYENIPREGPVTCRTEVTGRIDPMKRTVSFSGRQTIVEKERSDTGGVLSMKETTITFAAANVPVGESTGMSASDATFSGSNKEIGPTHGISATLAFHSVDYDSEDGSVRYESRRSARLLGGERACHATAAFIMNSVRALFP
jgi:hypothetical protein